MKTPAQADLQHWSDEVARDPKSLAFLPLARAYRRQGLRDAALQLCLRGLEAYPSHIEAHSLLALLYLESEDHEKAADEWSFVLRLDPDNFEALRGLGFCFLEQDHLSRARQMLERAALLRPADPAVGEALRVLGTRQELAEEGLGRSVAPAVTEDPWAAYENVVTDVQPRAAEPTLDVQPPVVEPMPDITPPTAPIFEFVAPPAAEPEPAAELLLADAVRSFGGDPTELFDDLLSTGPLLGALLVDAQGLVLAGRLLDGVAGDATVLGAVLAGAIGEATRTVTHLSLGTWRGILIEAQQAMLHLAPAGQRAVVVLAARRDAPAGWMLRAATQASDRATHFAQDYA